MTTPQIAYATAEILSPVSDPLASASLVSVLDPVFQTSTEYVALTNYFSSTTQLPPDHPVVTATAIAALSQPHLTVASTPAIEAVLTPTASSWLSGHLPQLNASISAAQNRLTDSSLLNTAIATDLSLGASKSQSTINQAQFILKQAYPILLPYHQQAEKIITNPEKVKEFQLFLKRFAIALAKSQGQDVPPEVIKAIEESSLTNYFQLKKIEAVAQPEELALTEDLAEEEPVSTQTATPSPKDSSSPRLQRLNDKIEFIKKTADTIEKIEGLLGAEVFGMTVGELAGILGTSTFLAGSLMVALTGAYVGTTGLAEEAGLLNQWATLLNQGHLTWSFARGIDQVFSTLPHWVSRLPYGFQPAVKAFGLIMRSFAHFADGIFRIFTPPQPVSITQSLGRLGVRANVALSSIGTAAVASVTSFLTITAVVFLSLPIVVALILFIINSSAFVVPPSGSSGNVGYLPGCPAEMWPVTIQEKYVVTQGPGGPGSHGPPGAKVYEEAIDIFPIPVYNPSLNLIVATHPGIVTASKKDGWGGNYIYLKDTCGGNFKTSYVHQLVNYVTVGQVVNTGDIIGVMGYTGHVSSRSPSGAHLHYAFLNTDGTWKNRKESPPFMITPYIPKTVPQLCNSVSECKTSLP